MTRKLVALVTAATISMAAAAPAVHAMGMEFNMLTGAVYNELKSRDLPTDSIDNLSIAQIGQIKAIVDDSDTNESNKTQQIKAIISR